MATFQGHPFTELLTDEGGAASFASAAAGRRIPIPGGNRVLVHRNAAAVHTLAVRGLCSHAELDGLRGAVGTAGTITLSRTAGVGLLLSVSPIRPHGPGCYVVDLRWRYAGSLTAIGVGGWGTNWGNDWGL